MADIIEVATHEFSEKGLAGARIDVIAEAMRTSKRMIYYYFGSKEGLYIRVLEEAYRRIREIESSLHLDDLGPEDALRRLVGFTVDYQLANPDFIRLVMTENIHRGEFLAQSKAIHKLNVPAIEGLRRVYERGAEGGRVPRRHRPGGPAHVDQRIELLQHRQPPHLRADLQARPGLARCRRGAARQHHRDGAALRPQVAAASGTGPASGFLPSIELTSSYIMSLRPRSRGRPPRPGRKETTGECMARSLLPRARRADGPVAGDDGGAGVRQRRAALRLRFRHHRQRGDVALAVRVDDLPRRRRGDQGTRAPGHRHAGRASAAGRQEGLPGASATC